ncbi:MAG: hypothetical protein AAF433_19455 [Bacteroidota bacterium]
MSLRLRLSLLLLVVLASFSVNTTCNANGSKAVAERLFIGYENFYLDSSLIRGDKLEPDGDQDEGIALDNWTITPADLEEVLRGMTKVTANEWYVSCYMTDLWYEGQVSDGREAMELLISPYSYIRLSNEAATIYFVQNEPTELFLRPCDCCEYAE